MKKATLLATAALVALGSAGLALRGQTDPRPGVTNPVALGKKVDPIKLVDTSGKATTVADWGKSKATVVLFISTQCPVSRAYDARMEKLETTYAGKGIRFVGINSNKEETGDDVEAHRKDRGLTFTVYKDPSNKVADIFDAHVTPEAYVINSDGVLVYHGAVDNSRMVNEVKTKYLANALDAVLADKAITEKETQAFGCSIKRVN